MFLAPWVVEKQHLRSGNTLVSICDVNWHEIATIVCSDAQSLAIATLIAAAPKLLEVCERTLTLERSGLDPWSPTSRKIFRAIRDAIADATQPEMLPGPDAAGAAEAQQ
jgi:hypothetical protein